MKGLASVIVLAILFGANAILQVASQTRGLKAGTTSGVASTVGTGAYVGLLRDILAQARKSTPQINSARGHGYPSNQNADQSYLLPWIMSGGDMGREFATMSMLMNSRGANSNSVMPFLFMGQDNMWPLMLMNSAQRGNGMGMHPATMMAAMGHEMF